jgi:TPR repeat protein
MNNYNKYLKYKKKYLELKYDNSQYGGSIVPCNKGYANAIGTCWAVAIQMIICFGHFTSGQLKCVMDLFNNSLVEQIIKNAEQFIDQQILKIKDDTELTNVFVHYDIFNEYQIEFVKKILHKFIERYYNKVMNMQFTKKPEDINPKENQERCEKIIAINYKNLFDMSHITRKESFGGRIYDGYLFCNLLSIFFLDYKVSFRNYYDNFNKIEFNHEIDLGILIRIHKHECCLFICNGKEKFYNDNDRQIYDCEWIKLLKKSTNNLYIGDGCLQLIDDIKSYTGDKKMSKVEHLTIISKYEKDTQLDIDIKKFLEFKDVENIKDKDLQVTVGITYSNNSLFKEAVVMYTLAAEQGDIVAQYNLGMMFYKGKGVTLNYEKAKNMFELAAKQNYSDAQYMLGNMFYDGDGVIQSYTDAYKMYHLAAVQDHDAAQYEIGYMYYYGVGIKQSYVNAKPYFYLAALNGNALAQYMMGYMYYKGDGVKQNYKKAKKMFKLAVKQGNASAQYELGKMFYTGEGVTQNDEKAKELFDLAAKQDNSLAQLMLRQMK